MIATERTSNLFLDALPEASLARFRGSLQLWQARVHDPIAHEGKPLERVVFPCSGVVSAVATMKDGGTVEVMTIGREGMFGIQLALGDPTNAQEAMIQLPGPMLVMDAHEFVDVLENDRAVLARVLVYAQSTLNAIAKFAGCNRLHQIEQRCARWLLMAHDRSATDEIMLTHEYLATMLGVRRPGVSLAAAALEAAGLIDYRRGRIVIRDRTGLERASCECYDAVNASTERLLGYGIRKSAEPLEEQPA